MQRWKVRGIHIVLFICAAFVLIAAIFLCTKSIRGELQKQMEENLQDVANQNTLALEAELDDKQNLLGSLAKELSVYTEAQPQEIVKVMEPFTEAYHFKRIGFIYPNGRAYTTDGYKWDLGFREFFKKGMQGQTCITGPLDDTIGEKEKITVFSTPVYAQKSNEVEGVLFATYRTKMFQQLIHMDSFGGKGNSYIIQSDGIVIANSPRSTLRIRNNILDYLKEMSGSNKKKVKDFQSAMLEGESGNTSFQLDDELYVYYMPIHYSFNNQPCYMLTTVPAKVLTDRISPVLRYVRLLLLIIAVVLTIMILSYVLSYRTGKRELLKLAYEDPLTNDDNYAYFALKMEERKDVQGFLISMDLSEFKIVNNICGIEKGDETLRSVWLVLRRSIRMNELAAHINADNFVIFLTEENQELLVARIEQLSEMITMLSEELNIPKLSPYFGIYTMKGQEAVEVAYSCANEAKHIIKGRHDTNYAFYDEVDFKQIMDEKALEDRFEVAIANHEFEVWYQPKYSADNAHIVGAEALTRWRNPDGSLVPPYKFIPLFEKNGMISQLDEYVFRMVCQQQKKWESEGQALLPVSVNISRASLYYSNVVEKYKKILDEYRVEAKYVPLEITESATIDNMEIRELIDQFHAAGFPLLLDDFGNGYSSLATLNVMHFDVLKLDKSLIDHIGDENGEKLLYYTIKLAKSLGMQITAEGVEYQEQVVFLQRLKCNDIQGFYFSKPLPLEEYQKQIGM